jgi:hypothetical protein
MIRFILGLILAIILSSKIYVTVGENTVIGTIAETIFIAGCYTIILSPVWIIWYVLIH